MKRLIDSREMGNASGDGMGEDLSEKVIYWSFSLFFLQCIIIAKELSYFY